MSKLYSLIKKVGYKVINIITLGTGVPVKINNFRLKFPTNYFRLFPSSYEKSSFIFFKKHITKGNTILDIGAHIGLYSVFFAKLSEGRIFSFEPTPSTVKILRKTIKINGCAQNVKVIPKAVSDKEGKVVFYSNNVDVSQSNSLVGVNLNDGTIRSGAYEVDVVSIDSFREEQSLKIDFLKIDAEGVELEVLKGAKVTFLNDRPSGIIGLHPFAYEQKILRLGEIWDILISYNLALTMDGNEISKDEFCNKKERVFDIEFLARV